MRTDPETLARALCGVPRHDRRPLPDEKPARHTELDDVGAAERLVTLLEAALPGDADVALSGGVDSAVLATLAVARDRRPEAWTLDDELDDEPKRAAEVARSLGVRHTVVPMAPEELPDHFVEAVRACGSALWNPRAVAKSLFWRRAARLGARRVMVGSGADELLGDPAPGLAAWLASRREQRRVGLALLRPESRAHVLDVEAWMGGVGVDDPRPGLLRSVTAHETLPPEVDAGHAAGIAVLLPYLDAALSGFALGLPARLRRRGGEDKWLLRTALAKRLPAAVLGRPKLARVTPPGGGSPAARARWLALLDALLSPAALERLACVDGAAARASFERHAASAVGEAGEAAREAALMRLASLVVLTTGAD